MLPPADQQATAPDCVRRTHAAPYPTPKEGAQNEHHAHCPARPSRGHIAFPIAARLRLKPRRSYGLLFEYHSDYDGRGIIHYIATNCAREPWTNAHAAGRIRVSASSIERGHLQDVVGATPVEVWSKDVPASWVAIDLGEGRSVIPTHYTLRHGGNYRADSLRNWDLQGSQDGLNWTVLRRHVNDVSLNNNFQSASWSLPGCVNSYRHFRILQNGHNSSNHNFLVLSGFEIYGELYES